MGIQVEDGDVPGEVAALQPKEPCPKKSKDATIDIHWNHQSSFTMIKSMLLIMLVSELATSIGLAVFSFTHPGDAMIDVTMGSFLVRNKQFIEQF